MSLAVVKIVPAAAALIAALTAGCAGTNDASVTEMNRTIQALRVQNAAYAKQVEELENRVFILGDQDEHKAAAPKPAPPPLPRVTLRRSDAIPTLEEEVASEDDGVEYAGEAAKPNAKRPLLRLYGDELTVLPVGEPPQPAAKPAKPVAKPAVEPRRLAVASEGRPRGNPAALELYRRSLDSLRGGQLDEALTGFREFLRLHPQHDLADNAQYWLGECYYHEKDYPLAMREFRRVVEKYPQGNKVADALLKVAFCHLALGSAEVGRQTLEQVVRSYPRHEAAALASSRLTEIGHDPDATKTAPRPERSREEQP
jgi:tol-pal system protein YbgF